MSAITVTQRLLWKERRSLQTIWLACTLGVAGLMVLLTVIATSQSPPATGFTSSLWGLATWVPPVYLFAVLAAMFAGEKEERTLVWLVSLSPSLTQVLGVKIGFAVISGLLMQVCLAATVLALVPFDDSSFSINPGQNLALMGFVLVEAVVFGWFCALQSSKPLHAILYAAFCQVLLHISIVLFYEWSWTYVDLWRGPWGNALGYWGWARLLFYTGLVYVNVRLSDHWLNGRPWDWGFVAAWWNQQKIAQKSTIALLEPTEEWRRGWLRLRWLEWQSLKTFALFVVASIALSCVSLLLSRHLQGVPIYILIWVLPICAGLMAWQGEQTHNHFRMLVNRGLSPLPLWLNKLMMWQVASLLGVALLLSTSGLVWEFLSAMERYWYSGQYHASPRWPSQWNFWQRQTGSPHPVMTAIEWFLLWNTATFLAAFTCAHLFRRLVVALGLALVSLTLLMMGGVILEQCQMPMLWFILPVMAWLLWISVCYLSAWWLERTSWRITRRRGVELALQTVFPFLLITAALGYRVWEVPVVRMGALPQSSQLMVTMNSAPRTGHTDWTRIDRLSEAIPKIYRHSIVAPAPVSAQVAVEQSQNLDVGAAAGESGEPGTQGSAEEQVVYDLDVRSIIQKHGDQIRQLRDQILATDLSLPLSEREAREFLNHFREGLPTIYLTQLANQELEAGEIDSSLTCLVAACRLEGAYSRLSSRLTAGFPPLRRLQIGLSGWAAHPAQTEATLKQGLQALALEERFWKIGLTDLEALRDYEIADQSAYWSWEVARQHRLANVALYNRVLYLEGVRQRLLTPVQTPRANDYPLFANRFHDIYIQHGDWKPNDPAWNYSGPRTPYSDTPILGLDQLTMLRLFEGQNKYRIALTMMAVVGYHRLHGELPEALAQVRPYFSVQHDPTTDLWTGFDFGYEPKGFAVTEPEFPPSSIFRQPLLWTTGPERREVIIQNNTIRLRNRQFETTVMDDSQTAHWIYPIDVPATKVKSR